MNKRKSHKSSTRENYRPKATNSIFHKSTLENGIRVVTEQIPYVRSASIGFWVEVGTRDEWPQVNGVSHFIEHMLFKGTEKRTAAEIAQSIENVGGHLNAFTSKEVTCYYAHVLDTDLPLAIDVLTDMLTHSIFDPEEISKEREVILDEINSVEEVPEERVHDYFYQDLFDGHSLGFSTLGTVDSIRQLSREQALDYMRQNYVRKRLVVAACGNIEHEQICKLIEKQFSEWVPEQPRKMMPPVPGPGKTNTRRERSKQTHICLGSQAFSFSDPRKYAALVMNTLLGAGMGSRLFQTVREKYGLCYNIYSYLDFFHDSGIFCIYTSTDLDKSDLALDLIHQELQQLQKEKIGAELLAATKSQLSGSLVLGLENTSSRMNRLAKMEIYLHKYYPIDDVIHGIEAVTEDEVLEVSRHLLAPEGLTTTIIKPL
ncbi:MAG: insulinase family protein [Calditrichaeota bacterium]|nr:MAG: insulinase family protein [Calditrichota bacterium]